jgi:hypothetical protein
MYVVAGLDAGKEIPHEVLMSKIIQWLPFSSTDNQVLRHFIEIGYMFNVVKSIILLLLISYAT